ncbi:subtilisin-like serine endopeptidase family protein [Striga asiatica]|uniref:Subtilisin-like serine endopeptidase family protein n=1 Tax=Striga asiatica TaxID=4170 RepID=A0A5A7QF17_STRAF|nr:subtilisin-like serine endopeptidase family protein [Striga asiatica]
MRGFHILFFCFNLLLIISILGVANSLAVKSTRENIIAKSKRGTVYNVYMGKTKSPNGAPRSDHAHLLSELSKRKQNSVVQTYNRSFLGFSARLSDEEAKSISALDGVVSVFPDRPLKLHTTRSWNFLRSLNAFQITNATPPSTYPTISNCSATPHDIIIGIFDTGIFPEHPSFSDAYMGEIPSRWKGICMPGEDKNSSLFICNNKVIGARYYDDAEQPGYILTARDKSGHGTHISSIAAGVPVAGASFCGLAEGTAKGGSPSARIAVYSICDEDGICLASAILKSMDDAISDGVDLMSLSVGGMHDNLLEDPIAIGAFHAMEKGIIVVCSVGNRGPSSGTLKNFVPWVLSVGATTIDRVFEVSIVLGGNNKVIKGGGINFSGLNKHPIYRLIEGRSASNKHNSSDASNCVPGSLNAAKVKGKIVLCGYKDRHSLVDKINTLMKQGAMGIIMIDNALRQLTQYVYGTDPFAAVTEEDGAQIRSYIHSTRKPVATILPTEAILDYKPAPVVPRWSGRGPIDGIKNLVKPDVTAPGVDILAAYPPINDTLMPLPSKEIPLFHIDSGTSMSCPHVSGLAATLKSHNPKWTPSAIKSAITTTAIPTNNLGAPITTDNGSRATPYDMGAGEINLSDSLSPGLVYETKTIDYIHFLCNLGYNETAIKIISSTVPDNFCCPDKSDPDLISDMNYPSIAVSGLNTNGIRKVKRTVTNVGEVDSTYKATVDAPPGVQVQVVPSTLQFTKNVKKLTFRVIFKNVDAYSGPLFGSIVWSNTKYRVRSPFVANID